MGIVFKNNAKTTLSSAVNNSTTTIPVTEGSVFPAVNLSGAGTFFLLTLDDETNNEIVKVTSCSGDAGNINLTVIRAQEGTTARAFSSGDKAELRFTSGTIDEIRSDNSVHTNIFTTANNSTTDFTLSDEVANENDLVVFIDGVFQAHNTFSVSGTTLTLATAPASGRVVTVYSIKGSRSASNVALATMTGDNSDTTLTLPVEPINENSVQVFFDGVYQNKDSFSISGTTLTFGVAPPTGVAVEALIFTKLAINTSSILSDTDADTKVQVEESSDEDKIRFDTGGTERLIIDDGGKIGIGTSTPSQILNVEATSTPVIEVSTLDDNNPASASAIDLVEKQPTHASNTATFGQSGVYGYRIQLNGSDNTLRIKSGAQTTITDRITLDRDTGNVGIGLTNPSAYGKLAVSGTATQLALNASSGKSRIGFFEAGTGRFYLDTLNGADGLAFVDADGSTERMRIDASGNLKFNSGFGSVGTAYGVRAWANINQSTDAIRDSGNVSTVSDEGTALYRINFSNAMPDTNYVLLGTASNENNLVGIDGHPPSTYSTTQVDVRIFDASNVGQELTNGILNVAVIR